jgi:hypothetical protein
MVRRKGTRFVNVADMQFPSRWTTAFAVLLATSMCGCGLSKPKPPTSRSTAQETLSTTTNSGPHYHYLTQAELAKHAATSPGRAVLNFWWYVQNQDFYRAHAALTREFQQQPKRDVQQFGSLVMDEYAHWLGNGPRVILEDISGSSATVVMRYAPPGFGSPPSTPVSFSLVREEGQWKIAYNFYLATRLSA